MYANSNVIIIIISSSCCFVNIITIASDIII